MAQFIIRTPAKFLEVRVNIAEPLPSLLGLCAGYESCEWRCEQLAGHLMEWLPEYALTERERVGIGSDNLIALAAKAARAIYASRDLKKRGEIGEILLHAIIRQEYGSLPAISKIYFKDSANDTVKGFDAVHVVKSDSTLNLWLGESKFYKDINSAINAVVGELVEHTDNNYLRSEFTAIQNKIDPAWPFSVELKKLIDRNRSLDEIFDSLCFPVFLTYESETISSYDSVSEEFLNEIKRELVNNHSVFCEKDLPSDIVIHLLLLPLKDKQKLVEAFDERLKACQIIAN